MITTREPEDWRGLQQEVAKILKECGFFADVEKITPTSRGSVEIDVYTEETVEGRRYTILCECKYWKTRVPQEVIHAFRTVVTDSGAHLGYIVSKAGFQSGALTAAELTNIRLLTWQEFQEEFEQNWVNHFLLPFIADRLDPLLTYTEPLLPRAFHELTEPEKKEFLALKDKYDIFGVLMMIFTPYMQMLGEKKLPQLPLRDHLNPQAPGFDAIPIGVLDSAGYREFLAAAVEYGDAAIAQFRRILKKES